MRLVSAGYFMDGGLLGTELIPLSRVGDGSESISPRSRREVSIARDHNRIIHVQRQGCSKLDRVIGPQGSLLGQVPGARHQVRGDLYVMELAFDQFESLHGVPQLLGSDPTHPASACQAGASFNVGGAGSGYPRCPAPQAVGEIRQRFIGEQWNDRRRVEVGDHRSRAGRQLHPGQNPRRGAGDSAGSHRPCAGYRRSRRRSD